MFNYSGVHMTFYHMLEMFKRGLSQDYVDDQVVYELFQFYGNDWGSLPCDARFFPPSKK